MQNQTLQEELDEIYNFDYTSKYNIMKLFTIDDKGASYARCIGGIGEALKTFIFKFRFEKKRYEEQKEENEKLKKENEELKKENEELKK